MIFHAATGGLAGVGSALAGFAAGFGALFLLWLIGGSGGGDVKMMGALGAWLGAPLILVVFVLSAAVALAGLVASSLWRRLAGKRSDKRSGKRSDAESSARMIPYAVPVAIATWVVMLLKATV